jgi:hypothetical protein
VVLYHRILRHAGPVGYMRPCFATPFQACREQKVLPLPYSLSTPTSPPSGSPCFFEIANPKPVHRISAMSMCLLLD